MTIFILCLKIFFCRILDVSMGTVRTVCTVKNKTLYAVLIGFFEVLIWFLIVKEALNSATSSIWVALAYAGGFATGTLVGGLIARKFITTKLNVQIITTTRDNLLLDAIKDKRYGMTIVEATGNNNKEKKYLLHLEIQSNQLSELKQLIDIYDPKAFVSVQEIKQVFNGYFGR